MSRHATAPNLSKRARSLIDALHQTGQSEDTTLAEFLNDVAESEEGEREGPELDAFLVQVAEELKESCESFIAAMKQKKAR